MNIRDIPRGDIVLSAVVLVLAEVENLHTRVAHSGVAMVTALFASVALAFRRVAPIPVAVICVGAQVVNQWVGVPVQYLNMPVVWLSVSIYTVARHCSLRRALAAQALLSAMFASTLLEDGSDWFFGLLVGLIPFLVGLAFRAKASERDVMSARVSEVEEQREADVAAALAEERARIARDLHDVIAHSVTVMQMQTGAAQAVLDKNPDAARESLSKVQEAGRQALTEMGTLVGMLHEDREELGLSPQPGLDQLPHLVEQSSGGRLDVALTVVGTAIPVSPGVQVSIYRVVQESLTNIRKHSTARHAQVCLTYGADRVGVEICNDGEAVDDGVGGQRGAVGMRERVEIYGGDLEAGALSTGGYRVVAGIPIEKAP